jgi:hypothetical protein
MNFKGLKAKVVFQAVKASMKLRKHSPEILVGVGIVGLVVGTVASTKAITKAEAIIDGMNNRLDHIKLVKENSSDEDYSKTDYQKDLVIVYTQTTVDVAKTVVPAVSLVIVSAACIIGGHRILQRRNMALLAAYKVLEKGFMNYRARVVEDYGEETDYNYRNGIRVEKVEEKIKDPETGKTKKAIVEKKTFDPNAISKYAKYFDENSEYWSNNPEYNLVTLLHRQKYWNDMLHLKGHVFLNDVYVSLGIPKTQLGQQAGWVLSNEGDNFIDFGIFTDAKGRTNPRSFVNGNESIILLDFNVDGYILDCI